LFSSVNVGGDYQTNGHLALEYLRKPPKNWVTPRATCSSIGAASLLGENMKSGRERTLRTGFGGS
jgi:hypothetical protein